MKELFSLLVDRQLDSSKICNVTPSDIEHNCTFIVDQSKLEHAGDIRADDCGVWKNNGSRPCIVTWNNNNAIIVAHGTLSCKNHKMIPSQYHIVRTYFIHRSYKDFRKVISVIHGMCGVECFH